MKKIILASLFTLTLFALFMVARVPAQFAIQYLPPQTPIQMQQVSGTVWKGHAGQLIYQGKPMGSLDWRIHPLSLLLAKLNADFTLTGEGIKASGNATLNKDQALELQDTTVDADAAAIPLPPSAQLVTPAGKVNAVFDTLDIRQGKVIAAKGIVDWKPARITAPAEYELGEAHLKVSGENGKIKGILSSKDGPLNTQGSLNLDPGGTLKTNIRISPHADTPQEIRDMLPMAGRPAADGSVTIRQSMRIY
ncbi:MAG: type II secretion system protein N [bacterium]